MIGHGRDRVPGLAERRADIEPNLQFELDRVAKETGSQVRFNKEAREKLMRFAMASDTAWSANFRDLAAAVTRMATLAPGGRIGVDQVEEEITRLREGWRAGLNDELRLIREVLGDTPIDLFDQVQLAKVIDVCRSSRSLSEAGRKLFEASREKRKSVNDADRLRKYLTKFGLEWGAITSTT